MREIGAFEKAKVMVEEGWADGRFCGFHGPSELTLLDVGIWVNSWMLEIFRRRDGKVYPA